MEQYNFNWLLKFLVNSKSSVNILETYCFKGESLDQAMLTNRKGKIDLRRIDRSIESIPNVLSSLLMSNQATNSEYVCYYIYKTQRKVISRSSAQDYVTST
jgi:hypothetical protein